MYFTASNGLNINEEGIEYQKDEQEKQSKGLTFLKVFCPVHFLM
jgi:hypothetical protein